MVEDVGGLLETKDIPENSKSLIEVLIASLAISSAGHGR